MTVDKQPVQGEDCQTYMLQGPGIGATQHRLAAKIQENLQACTCKNRANGDKRVVHGEARQGMVQDQLTQLCRLSAGRRLQCLPGLPE